MQKEAEIVSSAEHLHKVSILSLVNQTVITGRAQVAGERRGHTSRRMIEKRIWRSDEVTSPRSKTFTTFDK